MTSSTFRQMFHRHCTVPVAPLSVAVAFLLHKRLKLTIEQVRVAINEHQDQTPYINPLGILYYLLLNSGNLEHNGRYCEMVRNKIVRDYRQGRIQRYPDFCRDQADEFARTIINKP